MHTQVTHIYLGDIIFIVKGKKNGEKRGKSIQELKHMHIWIYTRVGKLSRDHIFNYQCQQQFSVLLALESIQASITINRV